jgi:hypothetical protein
MIESMKPPQYIDLYAPIVSTNVGPSPLALRIVTTPNVGHVVGGVPVGNQRVESYVLLSALPDELRRRVELAIQASLAAM